MLTGSDVVCRVFLFVPYLFKCLFLYLLVVKELNRNLLLEEVKPLVSLAR